MRRFSSFLLLGFSATLASCSCYKQRQEIEQQPTAVFQDVIKEILNPAEFDNNNLAIIKFYSPDCPACQMCTEPYTECAQKNTSIKFYAVNVDQEGELKNIHTIRALPTFIAFDHGNKIGSLVGYNSEQLDELIAKLTGGKTNQSTIITVTNPEHLTKELGKDKVIVKFFSTGCRFCRMIAPAYEALAKTHGNAITFLAVDIDAQPELSSQYAPNGFPVFYTFKGGKQVDKVLGARADELTRVVKELVQAQPKDSEKLPQEPAQAPQED